MIPKMLLRKRFGFLVLIVALAGVTLPFPQVFASTGPTLTVGCENPVGAICVDSQSSSGLPGSSFTAAIFLVNVTGFIGYDISMNWNQTVLQVTSVLDGNWSTGLPAFTLTNSTSQSTGTVQYSQVLLGNPTNIVNSTLFLVSFKFLGYGSTPIALSSVSLTGLINGVVSVLPPPTIINGRAFTPPPSSAALIHYKAKAVSKTLAGGSTQTLVADIANTGPSPAFVYVQYIITSSSGGVSVQTTSTLQLVVGGSSTVSISYTVPTIPIRYFVQARLFVSGNGLFFTFSGSTKTFHYDAI